MSQSPASVNINLSGIERRIDALALTTKRIEDTVAQNSQKIDAVSGSLAAVNRDLQALRASFEQFVNDNKRTAALQKAATELVRVRQELEQNFGGYKTVRETMLGVLQATDLALVKKTTISQVTEELMLSTPDYWLAPCLVAVSAWIGNDLEARQAEQRRAAALQAAQKKNPQTLKTAAIILAVLGAISFFAVSSVVGIGLFVVAIICFANANSAVKHMAEAIVQTNAEFDARILAGKQQIAAALSEWESAKALVRSFRLYAGNNQRNACTGASSAVSGCDPTVHRFAVSRKATQKPSGATARITAAQFHFPRLRRPWISSRTGRSASAEAVPAQRTSFLREAQLKRWVPRVRLHDLRGDHVVSRLFSKGHTNLVGTQQLQFYRRPLRPLRDRGT